MCLLVAELQGFEGCYLGHRVGGAEDGAAGDEGVGSGLGEEFARGEVYSAVDLDKGFGACLGNEGAQALHFVVFAMNF